MVPNKMSSYYLNEFGSTCWYDILVYRPTVSVHCTAQPHRAQSLYRKILWTRGWGMNYSSWITGEWNSEEDTNDMWLIKCMSALELTCAMQAQHWPITGPYSSPGQSSPPMGLQKWLSDKLHEPQKKTRIDFCNCQISVRRVLLRKTNLL